MSIINFPIHKLKIIIDFKKFYIVYILDGIDRVIKINNNFIRCLFLHNNFKKEYKSIINNPKLKHKVYLQNVVS